jgi:hypothetical protein
LTGALIGTVKDAQGGVLPGAVVRVSSPALIGGPAILTTNEKGQLRFPALPPGPYVFDIELQGFSPYHEEGISIGAGATIERTAVLTLAGLAESVAVEEAGSRIEARDSGFVTRFGPEDLNAIPTRRVSMFDFIRAAPGVSPTSPGSARNRPPVTMTNPIAILTAAAAARPSTAPHPAFAATPECRCRVYSNTAAPTTAPPPPR